MGPKGRSGYLEPIQRLLQGIDHYGHDPPARRLVSRVKPHQQLEVILGNHVKPLAIGVDLGQPPSFGNEVGRQMRALHLAHVVDHIVGCPVFDRASGSLELVEIGFSQLAIEASPILRSSQVSIANTAEECRLKRRAARVLGANRRWSRERTKRTR